MTGTEGSLGNVKCGMRDSSASLDTITPGREGKVSFYPRHVAAFMMLDKAQPTHNSTTLDTLPVQHEANRHGCMLASWDCRAVQGIFLLPRVMPQKLGLMHRRRNVAVDDPGQVLLGQRLIGESGDPVGPGMDAYVRRHDHGRR